MACGVPLPPFRRDVLFTKNSAVLSGGALGVSGAAAHVSLVGAQAGCSFAVACE